MSAAPGAPGVSVFSPRAEAWSAPGTGARAATGILLVHGFTGSPISLRPLAEQLAAAGFTVDVPRLPGHGTTWRDMMPTRYEDWRSHTLLAARTLAARCQRVVLFGLSMGGTLVLDVASRGELEPAGVVTVNGQILDRDGVLMKLAPFLEKLLPVVPPNLAGLKTDDIAKPGVSEQAYRWVPSAAGNSLLRALPRVREQLARMPCPVLVIYSERDHSVSPDNSRALMKAIRCPELTELRLQRSFHVATLDYDQPLILERVIDFADRLPGDVS